MWIQFDSGLSAGAGCILGTWFAVRPCKKLTVSLEDAVHPVTWTDTPSPFPSLYSVVDAPTMSEICPVPVLAQTDMDINTVQSLVARKRSAAAGCMCLFVWVYCIRLLSIVSAAVHTPLAIVGNT